MHSLVIASSTYRSIFYVAMAIFLAPEMIAGPLQRADDGAKRNDRGSMYVLTLSVLAGMLAAAYCVNRSPGAMIDWHQPIVFWTGIALMLCGVAFRWYAIRVLGRYFTRDVATHEGQTVVDRGPYRLVRHPSYSGVLITVLGIGLALTNWLSLLVITAFSLAGFTYRVRVEENALCEALGQPYLDYMKRTRRFIPYLW